MFGVVNSAAAEKEQSFHSHDHSFAITKHQKMSINPYECPCRKFIFIQGSANLRSTIFYRE